MASLQAKSDGTLETGEDPTHPSVDERQALLKSALEQLAWQVQLQQHAPQGKFVKFTADISRGARHTKLEAFIFPNLAYSGGGRKDSEKRIQLTRDYSEHAAEFNLDKNSDHKCLLLGVYRRGGVTVICAWDAYAYRDHANPSSCYVDVKAIAAAMRDGFGEAMDGKGRIVCCFRPEFTHYYIQNMAQLHERVTVQDLPISQPPSLAEEISEYAAGASLGESNAVPAGMARNRVIYGAPGTGKSHQLNAEVEALFPADMLRERVTFYPEYNYAQFIGSYRPVPIYREGASNLYEADKSTKLSDGKEPLIDYRFVPGPFLRMLCRAIKNPSHNFVLVIEELNRADAPAVFGEAFQMLDRADGGEGKFAVSLPPEAQAYLAMEGLDPSKISLPTNFYLWATMNSADQGVLPLDAAFKRRWSFEYLALNRHEAATSDWQIELKFLSQPIAWNAFRQAINDRLLKIEIAEDRLLGPFFMRRDELSSIDAFKNKILLYLRDDVVRHEPGMLFTHSSYGELARSYDQGENIFMADIHFPS
jgi:hypothetical protein